ncbi:MAG TPA: hypothetical protein VN667_22640 [Burkholderiales bacterium]|nr:hypothetical protein [Burkholderiales bacterium]
MKRQLPKRIHFNDGRYWHVKTTAGRPTWTPLTHDLPASIIMAERIEAGVGVESQKLQRALRNCWRSARWRAAKYKIPFDLSWEKLLARAHDQQWRCAITNIPLAVDQRSRRRAGPYGPSIDRIKAGQGYSDDNIRIVCVAINYALNEWGEDFFAALANSFLRLRRAKT